MPAMDFDGDHVVVAVDPDIPDRVRKIGIEIDNGGIIGLYTVLVGGLAVVLGTSVAVWLAVLVGICGSIGGGALYSLGRKARGHYQVQSGLATFTDRCRSMNLKERGIRDDSSYIELGAYKDEFRHSHLKAVGADLVGSAWENIQDLKKASNAVGSVDDDRDAILAYQRSLWKATQDLTTLERQARTVIGSGGVSAEVRENAYREWMQAIDLVRTINTRISNAAARRWNLHAARVELKAASESAAGELAKAEALEEDRRDELEARVKATGELDAAQYLLKALD